MGVRVARDVVSSGVVSGEAPVSLAWSKVDGCGAAGATVILNVRYGLHAFTTISAKAMSRVYGPIAQKGVSKRGDHSIMRAPWG